MGSSLEIAQVGGFSVIGNDLSAMAWLRNGKDWSAILCSNQSFDNSLAWNKQGLFGYLMQ